MAMTGDAGRGLTPEELQEFLTTGAIFAKLATTLEDGQPVVSPVWYEWDGSSFLIVSKARTSLVQNVRRDPRCGLLVDNPTLPYKRVSVQGRVELLGDDFDWQTPTRRMVLRYLGEDGMAYAESTFDFPRVPFRVWPVRMSTWNGGGYDRTFNRPTEWHEFSAAGPRP
jgi:PPOX class probable F420-dependent enzyme